MNWKIVHIDETDSTNRWLKDLQATGGGTSDDEATVVVADFQTAGRGCGTNTWESERGKNLLFSLLIHPRQSVSKVTTAAEPLAAKRQFSISMAISLAICDALDQLIGDVSIKWPNDIYWRNGKLGGILIEQTLSGAVIKDSIIGVGLNVNQRKFLSNAPNPVSLWQISGAETDRDHLLTDILQRFDRLWGQESVQGRESTQGQTLHERYMTRLYRRDGYHPYVDATGPFMARLAGVSADGRLLLADDEGNDRCYAFKEVQFVI
jgi:BirA family biotin operon repressor/biotin-[acetyl-CoA-carboxylase] ligase